MDILIPLILLEVAIALLVVGLILHGVDFHDGAAACLVVSLILFYVGGVMFIDVSETVSYPSYYSNGTLKEIVYDVVAKNYDYMVWLSVLLGFIPMLALYGMSRDEVE